MSTEGETGNKRKEHQSIERFKAFGKWWIVGTLVCFGFSIIGTIGNAIGIQSIDIRTIGSLSDLLEVAHNLNWQTALFTLFSAAAIGAMIIFLVGSASAWGKLFQLHKDLDIPDKELNNQIKSQMKKMKLVPLAVFGIFSAIIGLVLINGIYVVSGVNMSNAHDLINAYLGGHYITILVTIVGGAMVGGLMKHFRNEYDKVYDKIEPYLDRTRVL